MATAFPRDRQGYRICWHLFPGRGYLLREIRIGELPEEVTESGPGGGQNRGCTPCGNPPCTDSADQILLRPECSDPLARIEPASVAIRRIAA